MACITSTWRGAVVCAHMVSDLDWIAAHVGNDISLRPIPGCGSYQTTTAASAGTHAGGGAIDFDLKPYTDAQARRVETVARSRLKLAYFRPPITGLWQKHVHVLFSECSQMSSAATTQFGQYERGLNALANNGPDTGTRSYAAATMSAFRNRSNISAITTRGFTMADINTLTSQLNTLTNLVKGISTVQLTDEIGGTNPATGKPFTVKDALNRIMGALPSGSAYLRKDSDGSATRVLDSGDLATLTQALADIKDALPKAPGA